MKKDLAVRIGAILTVLMVAFLSILPDLVNAEGDGSDSSTEIVAQAPVGDVLGAEEVVEPEAPEVTEPEIPETPSTQQPEEPATPGTEQPVAPEEPGTPGTEQPVIPEEPGTPGTEQPIVPEEPGTTDTELPEEPETPGTELPTEPDMPGTQPPTVPETPEVPSDPGTQPPADVQNPVTQEPPAETAPPAEPPVYTVNPAAGEALETFINDMEKDHPKDLATRTVIPLEILDEMYSVNTERDDFTIEGTTVTGYKGTGGYIAIPDDITAIGDNAFYNNTNITGVLFPQNLRSIGSSAFNGCSNLEFVDIPASVTAVGPSAFANCTALASIGIGASTGAVSQGEFYNCKSLTSVSVPEGITSISSGAFAECSNLSSISLPSSLSSLDTGAFSGDVNLASISAAGGSYSSYDGCVYSGDGKQLLLCPQGKTGIAFSPQTVSITSGAFSGCSYLLSVTIPASVTSIAADTFSGSAVQSVTIPASVTSIGSQSGWQPSVVYGYRGTAAETWANEHHYVFESIDGTPVVNNGSAAEPPEAIEDADPAKTGGDDNNKNEKPSKSGTSTSTVYSSSPAGGTGTSAVISQNKNGRVNSTPKTGVEDYSMYFLFGAIFLIGIAIFAYSRKIGIDSKNE